MGRFGPGEPIPPEPVEPLTDDEVAAGRARGRRRWDFLMRGAPDPEESRFLPVYTKDDPPDPVDVVWLDQGDGLRVIGRHVIPNGFVA